MEAYTQITLNDWLEMKKRLRAELLGVKQSFVRIGYVLRKIEDQKLYEQDGYKSVAEFAKEEYGLEASTVSRFMSINREYSVDGYSEQLRPEYADLGRSQLEEMLRLPDGDRQMIGPEASREDIRELKRFNKAEPAEGEADDIRQLVEKFFEENPDVLNEIFAELEQGAANADGWEWLKEIVNPSGNRSFRKGLFFLMMYEDCIKIKKFGSEPEKMQWEEFFRLTTELFGAAAAGSKTWENYFGKADQADGKGEETAREEADAEGKSESGCEEGIKNRPEEESGRKTEGTDTGDRETGADHSSRAIETDGGEQEETAEESKRKNEGKEFAPAQKDQELLKETAEEVLSRKEYMDSLTAWGMAEYVCREYKEHRLVTDSLADPSELEKWLLQEVDQSGREIVDTPVAEEGEQV